MNDILMKRKESLAELRARIAQSTLTPEDLRINRPPYRKTSDLFASEYSDGKRHELFKIVLFIVTELIEPKSGNV